MVGILRSFVFIVYCAISWLIVTTTTAFVVPTVTYHQTLHHVKGGFQKHQEKQGLMIQKSRNKSSSYVAVPELTFCTPSSSSSTSLHLSITENPFVIGGIAVAIIVGGLWLYIESAPDRVMSRQRYEHDAIYQQYEEEKRKKAYIEPKEYWTIEEIQQYDGKQNSSTTSNDNEDDNDDYCPILIAADGLVYNVGIKGRNFYGPGREYSIFAGRDATRLLAKTIVKEETDEEKLKPLTLTERAALAGWIYTFKQKYDVVGKLKGFDPTTTSMKNL